MYLKKILHYLLATTFVLQYLCSHLIHIRMHLHIKHTAHSHLVKAFVAMPIAQLLLPLSGGCESDNLC